jgi:hypothetical protein
MKAYSCMKIVDPVLPALILGGLLFVAEMASPIKDVLLVIDLLVIVCVAIVWFQMQSNPTKSNKQSKS